MDKNARTSQTKVVVFIQKCRRKSLCERLRRHLGDVFHQLAAQKEIRIWEGHLMSDRSMWCRS